MQRNNRFVTTMRRNLKINSLRPLFRLLPMLALFSGCAIGATFEMTGFVKGLFAQLEEREAFLIESAEKPLTEGQEELLTQILQEEGTLDVVLSSQPYVAYLEDRIGAAHKDYPTYLAAVPTTEQKSATVIALKDLLPPEATDEQIQICIDFYFKFRELIVNEPDTTSDSEELQPFIEEHLVHPLMDTYPSKMSSSDAIGIMKIVVVPSRMAPLDTEVFRKICLKQLEVYGSREGLLRCAILTPDEFVLTRSFFEDIAALEKWIRLPPQQK